MDIIVLSKHSGYGVLSLCREVKTASCVGSEMTGTMAVPEVTTQGNDARLCALEGMGNPNRQKKIQDSLWKLCDSGGTGRFVGIRVGWYQNLRF